MAVVDIVKPIIEPIVEGLGFELVEVEYKKKSDGYNLTFFIDSKSGITVDDCEAVHRAIDEPLDELDPTNGAPYILNVSSCGLDRPLKTLKDYLRKIGTKVDVKFYAPYNGKKVYTGVIKCANESVLVITDENKNNIELEISKIAAVLPVIEF